MSAEPIDYRTHLAVAPPLQRGASNKYEPSRQQSLHQPLPKGRDGVELLRMHAGTRGLFSNLLHSQVTSSAGVLSEMQIRRQMLLSNYCLSYRFKLRIFASKCRKTDEKKKKKCSLCRRPDGILCRHRETYHSPQRPTQLLGKAVFTFKWK